MGFSDQQVAKLRMKRLEIFKTVLPDSDYNQVFHSNVQNFAKTVRKFDEKHTTNESLSNIFLVEGRIEKEISSV